ncbi:hypothetical protein TREMEDRAFT_63921 [Tremella mesenterica DSM 1558]|uniref:uncharacterized protein n=1 Tax=Tremella mesenterica (strain ATCC 24925 / CBS 8224 / DSM 1558 / NBRC 9311 / NRRL Y-6157 / RJB 2259-6 / UBC 559-6) TaxID=578456 RepID=UPI0003F49E4C|nr:uncharacterized protein TREMEDRAFT_63921 [Tremella mesenterica DSM 1558]EIW68035.1 hypothetical protein TREMEDRAFT_63921 [Tremella mesenterica DSM 1558]
MCYVLVDGRGPRYYLPQRPLSIMMISKPPLSDALNYLSDIFELTNDLMTYTIFCMIDICGADLNQADKSSAVPPFNEHHDLIYPLWYHMTLTKFTTVLFIGVAFLGAAIVKGDFYANFFDDTACTVNGGIGVSINNDGCLAEAGRGSVYFPNTGIVGPANQYCLVVTGSNGDCSCQSAHYDFTSTGFCHELNPSDQSYRIIHQSCAANNC